MDAMKNDVEGTGAVCPFTGRKADVAVTPGSEAEKKPAKPAMFTTADVERFLAVMRPLGTTIDWMRQFLARPHPELGRSGPVCPFVPGALDQNTIWLTAVNVRSKNEIVEVVGQYRDHFLELEPKTPSGDSRHVHELTDQSSQTLDLPMRHLQLWLHLLRREKGLRQFA